MRLGRVPVYFEGAGRLLWIMSPCITHPSVHVKSSKKINQVKQVIDTSPETARARLLLFYCAKKVLAEGMIVLGIEPLDRV